jgi:hypothetical protein
LAINCSVYKIINVAICKKGFSPSGRFLAGNKMAPQLMQRAKLETDVRD